MAFSKLPSLQFFRGFDPRSHHHHSSPALLSVKAFVSVSPSQLCLSYHRSSLKSLLDNRLPPDVGYSISACLNSFLMSVCVALRHKSSSASLCIFRESKYQTPSLRPHSQDTTICFHVSTWFITRPFHRLWMKGNNCCASLVTFCLLNKVAFLCRWNTHWPTVSALACKQNSYILYTQWSHSGAPFPHHLLSS